MENIMTKTAKSVGAHKAETVRPPKWMAAPAKATNKARLIALLSRKSGADVPGLSTTLGWLPHTTRAALTGLRKAGYEITKVKPGNGKPSRYQIIGSPEANVV
jgi:hypothetical protein